LKERNSLDLMLEENSQEYFFGPSFSQEQEFLNDLIKNLEDLSRTEYDDFLKHVGNQLGEMKVSYFGQVPLALSIQQFNLAKSFASSNNRSSSLSALRRSLDALSALKSLVWIRLIAEWYLRILNAAVTSKGKSDLVKKLVKLAIKSVRKIIKSSLQKKLEKLLTSMERNDWSKAELDYAEMKDSLDDYIKRNSE